MPTRLALHRTFNAWQGMHARGRFATPPSAGAIGSMRLLDRVHDLLHDDEAKGPGVGIVVSAPEV